MEKSIESIWKEGFLKSDALVAPKINDLYNKKSKSLIERLIRMMKINHIALVVFGLGISIHALFAGIPVLLVTILLLLFFIPAFYGESQLRKRGGLGKDLNSYEYLKSFDAWLKAMLERNGKMSSFFYPAFILAATSMVWFTEGRQEVLEKVLLQYPELPMIGAFPVYFIVSVVFFCTLAAVFGKTIYKWDVGLVYGRVFRKLEELIADLEELRAE